MTISLNFNECLLNQHFEDLILTQISLVFYSSGMDTNHYVPTGLDQDTNDVGEIMRRTLARTLAATDVQRKPAPPHPTEMAEYQPLDAGTIPGTGVSCRDSAEMVPPPPDKSVDLEVQTNPNGKIARHPSPLDNLPPETQAAILYLLDNSDLGRPTRQVPSPPPAGMGIHPSRSSLHRFHQRHSSRRCTRRRQEDASFTAALLQCVKSSPDLPLTASHLIALRLVETASEENSNPAHLLALSKAIAHIHAIQHADRRLRLAEQKAAPKTKAASS